jgi:hypothetical protein
MKWAGAIVLVLGGCVTAAEAPIAPRGLYGDAEGLQPAATPLRIDFGRAEAGTVAAVTKLLGAGPVETVALEDCGAGPVTAVRWENGLTLNFKRGTFLGWVSQEARGAAVTTPAGLGPGSLRAAVAGVPISQTSLGAEFEAGGVFGLLEGDRVGPVWAGVTCFFR